MDKLGYEEKYGWSQDYFSKFNSLSKDTWEYGYGCTNVALAKPYHANDNVSHPLVAPLGCQ